MSRTRIVIENLRPQVDCGRFPAKRVLGDEVRVTADIFADGHDLLATELLFRSAPDAPWERHPMRPRGNDRWEGRFTVTSIGSWFFTVRGWIDHLGSWQQAMAKKSAAGLATEIDLEQGAARARSAAVHVPEAQRAPLLEWADSLLDAQIPREVRLGRASGTQAHRLALLHPDPALCVEHAPALRIEVDRERARFSAWYETFPRSSAGSERHARFADLERLLPYVAEMGFDVLYLPPIHPIGSTERKGPNNAPCAGPEDPGSPWAIGSAEGGHKSIHAELGTLADFQALLARARDAGLEIALDIALQCSPDHPYVREHPEWFLLRPDGSVQFAENPPKQYQDIYPFWFETPAWESLWTELRSIFEFWIAQGVRIFRVDNPHTKPFAFWEWLIGTLRGRHPDLIFLAEAFTRPRVLYRLAKLGFTQSYNYFPWRNGKRELVEYFTELRSAPVAEFMRPNLWPNTPDILTEYLQFGGRAAFTVRLILAATLGASYGIYGPAFELMENRAREPGSEEYLDSEKYQLRSWQRDRPDSLRELIARVNAVRRTNPALQRDERLRFHDTDNELLLAYSKHDPQSANVVLVVANLDPHNVQSGWLTLDLQELDVPASAPFQAHDLLTGARYLWRGPRNYVSLNPAHAPAHLLRIRRRVRTERDFDYFM